MFFLRRRPETVNVTQHALFIMTVALTMWANAQSLLLHRRHLFLMGETLQGYQISYLVKGNATNTQVYAWVYVSQLTKMGLVWRVTLQIKVIISIITPAHTYNSLLGACFCDDGCAKTGDCCADIKQFCPWQIRGKKTGFKSYSSHVITNSMSLRFSVLLSS